MIPMEFSQNNTLLSISYWKTIEDLEAFGRRPIHLKGVKFLVSTLPRDKSYTIGIMVSNIECCVYPIWQNLGVHSGGVLDQESCFESNTPIKWT